MKPRSTTSIASALILLATLTFLPQTPLHAGDRRRAVAVSPPPSDLTLTFLDGPVLDTGPIVWRGGARMSTIVTRTVVLRIGAPSSEPRGTATLRAFLEIPDSRASVRLDGILLGTAPRIIQLHAPIGIAMRHRIEIEVPTVSRGGPLTASLGWEVTTD